MPIQEAKPVGKLERLIELGRNPAEWGSCSEPNGAKNQGCAQWFRCKWRDGPHNFGALVAKPTSNGPTARHVVMACFDLIRAQAQISDNGGAVEIVAREGEDFDITGTKRAYPNDPTRLSHVSMDENDPEAKITIPRFPDPAERADFSASKLLMRLREKSLREAEAAKKSALLGIPVEPLKADSDDESPKADEGRRGPGRPRKQESNGVPE